MVAQLVMDSLRLGLGLLTAYPMFFYLLLHCLKLQNAFLPKVLSYNEPFIIPFTLSNFILKLSNIHISSSQSQHLLTFCHISFFLSTYTYTFYLLLLSSHFENMLKRPFNPKYCGIHLQRIKTSFYITKIPVTLTNLKIILYQMDLLNVLFHISMSPLFPKYLLQL